MQKEKKINPMVEASKEVFQKIYISPHISENYSFTFKKNAVKIREIPKNCKAMIKCHDGLSSLKIGAGVHDDIYMQFDHHTPVFISKKVGLDILDIFYAVKQLNEKTSFQKTVKSKNKEETITCSKQGNNFAIQIGIKLEMRYTSSTIDDLIVVFEKIEKFLRSETTSSQ